MTVLSVLRSRHRRFDIEALLPAVLFPIGVCLLGAWWSVYQFHTDEGVNLLKSVLVAKGYGLYNPIWDDQPPVLTLILAGFHLIFPYNVPVARGVILAFASVLLWSLFRVVRRTDGTIAAWIAVLALGSSNLFLTLSVSVMIGLPAIALALCAIDQAMVGAAERTPHRFLLAGLIFGISLQTKMFTGLVLPSLVCAVLLVPNRPARNDPRRARDIASVLATAIGTFLAIAVAMREPLLAQLVSPHLWSPAGPSGGSEPHGWIYLGGLLAQEPIVLGLGIAGIIATLLRPHELYGARLIPILWLCVSVVTFAYHRPVWPHHLPMTLVPLAWLGGSAIGTGLAWIRAKGARSWFLTAYVLIFFAAISLYAAQNAPDFNSAAPQQNPLASAMSELKSDPSAEPWVVTDYGMDAYRAGIPVPPELAVFTGKRVSHGYLSAELILSAIRDRKPSQVMFRRFPIDPEVRRYLNSAGYVRMIWSAEPHYIRADLAR